jgi:glutaredoxin
MITLTYPPETKEAASWEERIKRMSLPYLILKQNDIQEPEIVDDGKHIQGVAAIENYLSSLEIFVAGWYEDRCDLHEYTKGLD